MKNIEILGGGISNGVFVVRLIVLTTGKEFIIIGKKAERFLEKYKNP